MPAALLIAIYLLLNIIENNEDIFFFKLQQETQSRKRAEELNERVLWWSIAEAFAIFLISIAQTLILRNFFTDRTPNQPRYGRL